MFGVGGLGFRILSARGLGLTVLTSGLKAGRKRY